MDMRTYDVTSLVYLSTDIVIADLSEDRQHQFTATVTETLYGALHPGDKLTTLTPFLTFFSPMQDGMRVILFLDSRPHQYDFLYKDLARSPYAVPPSGVYLIDGYGHVHGYFQTDNPGPYVAWGYGSMLQRKIPTKEEDLAFPSLEEEKSLIGQAVSSVATVRPLLSKSATRGDVPALLDLIDASPTRSDHCDLREAGAIHDRVLEQLHSLKDPSVLLRMHALAGDAQDFRSYYGFVDSDDEQADNAFAAARVRFLVAQLADRRNDLKTRLAAVEILRGVSSSGSYPHLFALTATKLRTVCRAIFDDESQDPNLRGLCLEFLLDQPAEVADARRVFARTRSATLRFLIEEWFLDRSDDLYETLHAPSGPAASIVLPVRSCNSSGCCFCGQEPTDQPVFLVEYHMRKDFFHLTKGLFDVEIGGKHDVDGGLLLTDIQSGRQFELKEPHLINYSNGGEVGWEKLPAPDPKDTPPGEYILSFCYKRGDAIVSIGFGTPVSVRKTPAGNKLMVNTKTYPDIPLGWGW
jgi:hypothetical protein